MKHHIVQHLTRLASMVALLFVATSFAKAATYIDDFSTYTTNAEFEARYDVYISDDSHAGGDPPYIDTYTYDVTGGSVSINGLDVRKVKRRSLLRQVAVVGQHPFLFNRPIAENIRYGKPDATHEEVMAAARAAYVHEAIESFPHGYQTMAGEGGSNLSGGERQRVTIARAILKDAPILLLDEATSSLDPESERLVQQGLGNLLKGRTAFVIAHRLSTIRNADQVLVINDGRIIERGTHDELLKQGGFYHALYMSQFRRAEAVAVTG